jgi:hypothetical protein
MQPELKAPSTNLLTLTYNEPLSTFAFKFNLRRYNVEQGGLMKFMTAIMDHDDEEMQVNPKP